jgi:ssDNA-binding Zn-finger/Zn-ribbon topoisomerase 1
MENLLIRSQPCPECGTEMLWTQNAWQTGDLGVAAYRCLNGHLMDPAETRQCPACGVHDTVLLGDEAGRQQFKCSRCSTSFAFPH